jgi:hypothetical protein
MTKKQFHFLSSDGKTRIRAIGGSHSKSLWPLSS